MMMKACNPFNIITAIAIGSFSVPFIHNIFKFIGYCLYHYSIGWSDGKYPGLRACLLCQDEHGGGDGDGEAEEARECGHQSGGGEGLGGGGQPDN